MILPVAAIFSLTATSSAFKLPTPPLQSTKWVSNVAKSACATAAALAVVSAPLSGAHAFDKKTVGSIAGSGLLFKDKLIVDAFSDPKIDGVTVYLSDFERPITERMQGDFFSDPSQAGLGCARSDKITIKSDLSKDLEGEEIVSESRSLLFKSLKIRRVYDVENNNAVYVAFSTRINKGDDANKSRFSSSLCVVPLD